MEDAAYKRLLGARILSEANDIKRTTEALAEELNYEPGKLAEVLGGRCELDELYQVIDRIESVYPIDGSDLRVIRDDCTHGAKLMRAEESKRSSRVFDRPDRHGNLTPYYEYRDTACSRLSPFRPEWIRELRVVADADPHNPDVAYNKGHFLHQYTLYVGPVNFYWEVDGRRYGRAMNTGDSSYGTPWWPHTFASRRADESALILAVTFGGDVRRAQKELYSLGERAEQFAFDFRAGRQGQIQLIRQHMTSEMMSDATLQDALRGRGATLCVATVMNPEVPLRPADLEALAACLNVEPADLVLSEYRPEEEIVIEPASNHFDVFPSEACPAYRIQRMARLRRMPLMKGFSLSPVSVGVDIDQPAAAGAWLSSHLHTWLYNYGDTPVQLVWSDGVDHCETTLDHGDSGYLQPFISHAYVGGDGVGKICEVRVSGAMNLSAQRELSYLSDPKRVYRETLRWF